MRRVVGDRSLRRVLRPRGPARIGASEHQQAGVTVLHVDGEVDILTAAKLAARLHTIIRRGSRDVVVDLHDAVFIDSAGLYILLNAQRRLARVGRAMAVICGEGPVLRVIELARLGETLGVVATFEEYEALPGAR